jgi:hypothetical protein
MNKLGASLYPVEIPSLARTREIDGVHVSLQCFLITGPAPRYEIVVAGRGQSGVVDVPADPEIDLDDQMEEVAVCFATALKIQSEYLS